MAIIFVIATFLVFPQANALPEDILAPVTKFTNISVPAFKPLWLSSLPEKFLANFSLAPGVSWNPIALDDLIWLAISYKKDTWYRLRVNSGYRSNEDQKHMVKVMTASGKWKFVAPVGSSEHLLGTAFDFGTLGNKNAYTWLDSNSWKYGFIRTYRAWCEAITWFPEEKWHYRWVGRDKAKAFEKSGMTCLTEFLEKK